MLKEITLEVLKNQDKKILETIEADGKAETFFKSLVKLEFLKILFIDIGISLGDVLTDFAQGFDLIFDREWNIQRPTFHYGLFIIGCVWLPVIPVFLHILSFNYSQCFERQKESRVPRMLLCAVCFPLLPALLYAQILLIKNRGKSEEEQLKFMRLERTTKEFKSLVGATESSIQFTFCSG